MRTARHPPAAAGKEIYGREGCARRHSIAGEGSPRSPLDGVGERLSAEEIRKWIVAAPELEDELSGRVFRAKQAYGKLPEAELVALAAYLRTPRPPRPNESVLGWRLRIAHPRWGWPDCLGSA